MANIEQHISELLFDHDCVIVPSLGGFLASNQHATLSPNQFLLPPFRKIAFNVYLKNNDGLLANHLVEYEHISYQQALVYIESFVSNCMKDLNSGKRIILNNIGTLYFDREHNVQFEAARNSNHLKDSFGMEGLQLITVNRENDETPRQPSIVRDIRPSQPAKRSINPRIKKNNRLIGIIAISAAALWFSVNLYLVNPKKYEAATLVPFDTQSVLKIKDTNTFPPTALKNESPAKVETVYVASTPPDTTAVATIQKEKAEILPAVSNRIHHFVIAGVFKIHENALSLLNQLKTQGFESASVQEANSRWYVYYQGFENRTDALSLNDSLKKTKMEGWIWNY